MTNAKVSFLNSDTVCMDSMKGLLGECQTGNYIGAMPRNRLKAQAKIAVIGYGSQGRAVTLNFRDSGYDVLVGLPRNSKSKGRAKKDGIKMIGSVRDIVKKSDIVCFAFPDYLHGRVYRSAIKSCLNDGATLLFLHGFSVHFGFVQPPKSSDVLLIAPHAPGIMVREKFLGEKSLSAFYAVHQNPSGNAQKKVLELAGALGFEKKRLLKTTFEIETIGDLFGEQAVLCGGLTELIKNGFEVLIENGVPPKHAYLEVAFQLDQIIALIKKYGLEGMYRRISVAAQLGSVETGPFIIDKSVKKKMRQKFQDIVSGKFGKKLNAMNSADIKALRARIKKMTNPAFERSVEDFN
ncbi:MAG: ketol-acid reductoisomerase [Candidatus Zixiibacteriota bacterium]